MALGWNQLRGLGSTQASVEWGRNFKIPIIGLVDSLQRNGGLSLGSKNQALYALSFMEQAVVDNDMDAFDVAHDSLAAALNLSRFEGSEGTQQYEIALTLGNKISDAFYAAESLIKVERKIPVPVVPIPTGCPPGYVEVGGGCMLTEETRQEFNIPTPTLRPFRPPLVIGPQPMSTGEKVVVGIGVVVGVGFLAWVIRSRYG